MVRTWHVHHFSPEGRAKSAVRSEDNFFFLLFTITVFLPCVLLVVILSAWLSLWCFRIFSLFSPPHAFTYSFCSPSRGPSILVQ